MLVEGWWRNVKQYKQSWLRVAEFLSVQPSHRVSAHRFTNARVTAKYYGIKLEYREQRHTVYELLGQLNAKLKAWKGPYSSQDSVRSLLQDWHVSPPVVPPS